MIRSLRELEDDLLIVRKVCAEIPPKLVCSLNPTSQSMEQIINDRAIWESYYNKKTSEKNGC